MINAWSKPCFYAVLDKNKIRMCLRIRMPSLSFAILKRGITVKRLVTHLPNLNSVLITLYEFYKIGISKSLVRVRKQKWDGRT